MIGHVQEPLIETTELENVVANPTYGEDDLVKHMALSYTPSGALSIKVTFKPISHGPVGLIASDGRVTLFNRAWCEATLDDGRVGYAVVEWNIVVMLELN